MIFIKAQGLCKDNENRLQKMIKIYYSTCFFNKQLFMSCKINIKTYLFSEITQNFIMRLIFILEAIW